MHVHRLARTCTLFEAIAVCFKSIKVVIQQRHDYIYASIFQVRRKKEQLAILQHHSMVAENSIYGLPVPKSKSENGMFSQLMASILGLKILWFNVAAELTIPSLLMMSELAKSMNDLK
jgi:hypothetical protein